MFDQQPRVPKEITALPYPVFGSLGIERTGHGPHFFKLQRLARVEVEEVPIQDWSAESKSAVALAPNVIQVMNRRPRPPQNPVAAVLSPTVGPMVIACVVLEVIGWILPIGSAIVAFRRLYPAMPDPRVGEPTTYGAVERWMQNDIPDLFRSRKSALKWPALVAAFGITCSTASSLLSLLFLTS